MFTFHLEKPHSFKPSETCCIKLHHVYINDFNMLCENLSHWEVICNSDFLNHTFSEHFLHVKDCSLPL